MSFGNPLALLFLASAGIPVVIHLMYKRRRVAMPFSSLMFFHGTRTRLAQKHRLQEILVMIARCLLLALLALALARPSFQGTTGTQGAIADTIIILDNSASMSQLSEESTAFSQALVRARECVEAASVGSRIALMTVVPTSPPIPAALSHNKKEMLAYLERLCPSDGQGSISGTVLRASELLADSSTPNQELVIISDLQRAQFDDEKSLTASASSLPDGTQVILCGVKSGAAEDNLTITDLSLPLKSVAMGRETSISVMVRNLGSKALESLVSMSVEPGGDMQKQIRLAPNSAETACTFFFRADAPGTIQGRITLPRDAFSLDNRAFFTLEAREIFRILVASHADPEPYHPDNLYLCAALDPTGDSRISGASVTVILASDLASATLGAFDAVILHGVEKPAQRAQEALARYVKSGGALWVFPLDAGNGSGDDPASRYESPLLPARFAANPIKLDNREGIRVPDVSSLIFKGLLANTPNVPDVWVEQYFPLDVDEQGVVLMETRTGKPLVVEWANGNGKVLISALPASVKFSNWVLKPLFLGMLHNWIQLVAEGGRPNTLVEAGQPLVVPLHGAQGAVAYGPDGLVVELAVQGDKATLEETGRAGIYRLEYHGAVSEKTGQDLRVKSFAVNVDPRESDLSRISLAKAARFFNKRPTTTIGPGQSLRTTLVDLRHGREFFGLLVWLALVVLIVETALANLSALGRLDRLNKATRKFWDTAISSLRTVKLTKKSS